MAVRRTFTLEPPLTFSEIDESGERKDRLRNRNRAYYYYFSVILVVFFISGIVYFPSESSTPSVAKAPIKRESSHKRLVHIGRQQDYHHRIAKLSSSGEENICEDVEYHLTDAGMFSEEAGMLSSTPASYLTPLQANVSVSGIVGIGEYHYYQVCVATHPNHHHSIEFTLECDSLKVHQNGHGHQSSHKAINVTDISYNADLLISVDNDAPTREAGSTWMSTDHGSDFIRIPTYVEDFMAAPSTTSGRGKILYVGVYGYEIKIHGVRVLSLAERAKLSQRIGYDRKRDLSGSASHLGDVQATAIGRTDGPTGIPYSLRVAIRNIPEKQIKRRSSLRGRPRRQSKAA